MLISGPRCILNVPGAHVNQPVLRLVRVGPAEGAHSHVVAEVAHVPSQSTIPFKIKDTFFPLRVSLKKLLGCERQGRLCNNYRQIHVI